MALETAAAVLSDLKEGCLKDKMLIQNAGSNQCQVFLDQKSVPSAVSYQ